VTWLLARIWLILLLVLQRWPIGDAS